MHPYRRRGRRDKCDGRPEKSRTRRNKAGAGQISHIVFGALLGNPAARHQLPATVNAGYVIRGHLGPQARIFQC
jgi:hypothetical protein